MDATTPEAEMTAKDIQIDTYQAARAAGGGTADACRAVMKAATSEATQHEIWPHLPAAPWMYVGNGREIFQAVPGDPSCPIQPGATCDHCGTAICDVYRFRAADGRTFKVGSTCVSKMLAECKSNSLSAAQRAARKVRSDRSRERRQAKN